LYPIDGPLWRQAKGAGSRPAPYRAAGWAHRRGTHQTTAWKTLTEAMALNNGEDYGDYDKRIAKAHKKYGGT
jgi:hypothetical protein